jgi:hypothetical protein
MKNTCSTDVDYADMVNPFVRAEEEAEDRGRRRGICEGIFGTILTILAIVAAAYTVETRSAEAPRWWVQETYAPIRASAAGCSISVSHNNATGRTWRTFCVR